MTIEQLIGLSADEAEKMSKEDLEKFWAPYLNITRPERQEQKPKRNVSRGSDIDAKLAKLAKMGYDIDELI